MLQREKIRSSNGGQPENSPPFFLEAHFRDLHMIQVPGAVLARFEACLAKKGQRFLLLLLSVLHTVEVA